MTDEAATNEIRDSDGTFTARPDVERLRITKKKRLRAILEFARTEKYTTLADLADWLEERGLKCNQGQLSRDMEQLGIAPYVDRCGNKHLGRRTSIISDQLEERYVKIYQEAVRRAELQDNMVLITVVPGCAQPVATIVEATGWTEVRAVFCGTENVVVLCSDEQCASDVYDRLREGYL